MRRRARIDRFGRRLGLLGLLVALGCEGGVAVSSADADGFVDEAGTLAPVDGGNQDATLGVGAVDAANLEPDTADHQPDAAPLDAEDAAGLPDAATTGTADADVTDAGATDTATTDAATTDAATTDTTAADATGDATTDAALPLAAPQTKITHGGDFVPVVMTNPPDGVGVVGLAAKGPSALPLIYGPQGGHHVWITTCVPQWLPGPVAVEMRLRDQQTGELHDPSPVKLKSWHKDTKTIANYRCRGPLALYVSCPCAIDGRPLRLEVTLTGSDGKSAWLWAPVVAVHDDTPCEAPGVAACQP